jgi:molybdopterin biosynthesis enzyme
MAEELCKGRKLMELRPYKEKKVGIVITGSEVYTGRIRDKFEGVLRAKMDKYPSEIIGVTFCDDDLDMIVNAAKAHIENGADLLFMTGGMSVDPDDLTPTAIRQLGAGIISYGVPAQPGNMTLIAYLDNVTIMGVPGASISRPTTVFDALMPQVFAGDPLTKEDLINLGDGGACQMCKVCHFPNCTFGKY